MAFKHRVDEKTETIKRSETWSLEIAGYDIDIHKREDDVVSVNFCPCPATWGGGRLPLFTCYPKGVEDFEALADKATEIFRGLAAEMRAAGLVDLRSRWDKERDRMDEWKQEMHKAIVEGRPIPEFKYGD